MNRLVTKSSRCKSLKKCNNTKLKGVRLQNEGAPLVVQDLHHEDVVSMSNLGITLEAIFHSFV